MHTSERRQQVGPAQARGVGCLLTEHGSGQPKGRSPHWETLWFPRGKEP